MKMAALRKLLRLQPVATPMPPAMPTPPLPAGVAEDAIAAALRDVPPEWHVVPGQRIELGDTGFSVTLLTGPDEYTYELGGPEGQKLARSGDLPALKQVAMRLALERRQFMYPPAPVK